jgi:hypothetical protein
MLLAIASVGGARLVASDGSGEEVYEAAEGLGLDRAAYGTTRRVG